MRTLALSLIAFAILSASHARAQTITVGSKTGLDGTRIQLAGLAPTRLGLVTGATVGVEFLRGALGLQLEALGAQKGAGVFELYRQGPFAPVLPTGLAQERVLQARLGYLEIPLLVKLAPPVPSARVRPIVLFGVAPAFEFSCGGQVATGIGTLSFTQPAAFSRPLDCNELRSDRMDWSTIGAAGIEVTSSRGALTLEVRNTHGYHNIASGYNGCCGTYNRAWSVLVGASVPLSRGGDGSLSRRSWPRVRVPSFLPPRSPLFPTVGRRGGSRIG